MLTQAGGHRAGEREATRNFPRRPLCPHPIHPFFKCEKVLAEPVAVKHLELHSCTVAEALGVDETPFTFAFEQPARISAFAGW